MLRWPGEARAVSPVIGVILLVSIAVLLAGVTSAFVLNLGDADDPAPQFAGETTYDGRAGGNGEYLNVTHQSGEPLRIDNVSVRVADARSVNTTDPSDTEAATYDGTALADADGDGDGLFEASERIVIDRRDFAEASGGDAGGDDLDGPEQLDLSGAVVRIVWEDPDGQRTAVVYECAVEAPNCESER